MSYLLEFELAGLPKMTNSLRVHWRRVQGHGRLWKRMVWARCWHVRPPEPLTKAKLTLVRHSSRRPDFDGLVSGFKPIIDGLVEARIIENDHPEIIGQPEYKWELGRAHRGRVSVRVEEVKDE